MADLRYGVVGLGSMGRHHVRNIRALDGAELVAVADPFGDKFGVAGDTPLFKDIAQLIDAGVDAVVVAVPTSEHHAVAKQLIENGIHVLVEKPLAATIEEAAELTGLVEQHEVVGAVGYVERCNPAIRAMREKIEEGLLGEIHQIATVRQSPFPARIKDVGVVKDLATHDLDLTAWVAKSEYQSISAITKNASGRDYEDFVSINGVLSNGVIVNHLVNWMSPYKERKTVVTGENGALVAETVLGDLTYYKNGIDQIEWEQISNFRGVSEGEVIRYAISKPEPLSVEHRAFYDAVVSDKPGIVTFAEGLRTMRVVEAALESAKSNQTVFLEA